jgi:hypothetical protein
MTTADATLYCPCCGQEKPAWDYAPGLSICSLCARLSANDASLKTRATIRVEHAMATQSAAGRKAARIAARMAQYAQHGKRCTACHHLKPATAYNKCQPQPDGLQPICRECHVIRMATIKSGGLKQWHMVRDAMRASSPEGK